MPPVNRRQFIKKTSQSLAIFSCLGAMSCVQSRQPNIILFLADDLSYDDLGYTGNPYVKTPFTDQFAANSLSFENMFTPTAMCAPSRSCLYTGLYPHQHGCHYNHGTVKESVKSIPHYLKPLGYNVALVEKKHIKTEANFPFDYLTKENIEAYLATHKEKPLCLIFASNEPHGPHVFGKHSPDDVRIPEKWVDTPETRKTLSGYYADIALMDQEFETLVGQLKEFGFYENSVIMFTSDHGYGMFKKWTCYNDGLKVPFYMQGSGIKAGTKITALTSFIDVMPTLIDLAGGQIPDGLDGKSLTGLIKGEKTDLREYVFGSHTNRGVYSGTEYPIRSVRDKKYKYIENLSPEKTYQNIITHGRDYNPKSAGDLWKSWVKLAKTDHFAKDRVNAYLHRPFQELYDLTTDPKETHNLAGDPKYAPLVTKYQKILHQWMEDQGDKGVESEREIPMMKSSKTIEK